MVPAETTREQAAVWKDTVLNPLIAGLRGQEYFLESGNWSWRQYKGKLEHLQPVKHLIGYYFWPNAEQMFEIDAQLAALADGYDRAVDRLEHECQEAFMAILQSPELRRLVDRHTTDEERQTPRLQQNLAEYIVNGLRELPDHYGTSPVWNREAEHFLSLRHSDPSVGAALDLVAAAGQVVQEANTALKSHCETMRNELARQFGLPRVAPRPTSFAAEQGYP